MEFLVRPLRFELEALEPVYFPAGGAPATIRSVLGLALKRTACLADCQGTGARYCELACPYHELFKPSLSDDGPSGLRDLPRPFVLRVAALNGRRIPAGDSFTVDLNLFDPAPLRVIQLARAFAYLEQIGLSLGRARTRLARLHVPHPDGVLSVEGDAAPSLPPEAVPACVRMPLLPADQSIARVRVDFVTPTDLSGSRQGADPPPFWLLYDRLSSRVRNLHHFYHQGTIDLDFPRLREKSREIGVAGAQIAAGNWEGRPVWRPYQSFGGAEFLGRVTYSGDLGPFLPLLRLGSFVGVGRHTTWGKGQLEIQLPVKPDQRLEPAARIELATSRLQI